MKQRTLSLTLLASLLLAATPLHARFLLKNESIIKEKAAEQLEKMSAELKEKTGVSYYIAALQYFRDNRTIHQVEEEMGKDLEKPYVLLIFSAIDKKVDMVVSEGVKPLDKNDILDNYVIPLLIQKRSDISDETRYSAALFNGSARTVSLLQRSYGVKLESAPGDPGEEKTETDTGRLIRMAPLLILVLFSLFIIYRRKFKKS